MKSNATPGLNIDISETTAITCDSCGHDKFVQSFMMRVVSAIYSPNGEESLVPVPVFECSSCGFVNPIFVPEGLKPAAAIEDFEDQFEDEDDDINILN